MLSLSIYKASPRHPAACLTVPHAGYELRLTATEATAELPTLSDLRVVLNDQDLTAALFPEDTLPLEVTAANVKRALSAIDREVEMDQALHSGR